MNEKVQCTKPGCKHHAQEGSKLCPYDGSVNRLSLRIHRAKKEGRSAPKAKRELQGLRKVGKDGHNRKVMAEQKKAKGPKLWTCRICRFMTRDVGAFRKHLLNDQACAKFVQRRKSGAQPKDLFARAKTQQLWKRVLARGKKQVALQDKSRFVLAKEVWGKEDVILFKHSHPRMREKDISITLQGIRIQTLGAFCEFEYLCIFDIPWATTRPICAIGGTQMMRHIAGYDFRDPPDLAIHDFLQDKKAHPHFPTFSAVHYTLDEVRCLKLTRDVFDFFLPKDVNREECDFFTEKDRTDLDFVRDLEDPWQTSLCAMQKANRMQRALQIIARKKKARETEIKVQVLSAMRSEW